MPIPEGIEPLYVWALLWAGVNLALLAAYAQQPKDTDLADRARVRTFNRLADLNEYLQRMLDDWSGKTVDDLIGGSSDLASLKRVVDRAAYIESLVVHQSQAIAVGRILIVLELAAALVFGILVYLGFDRGLLSGAAIILAGFGAVATIGLLVYASILNVRITRGGDFV